MGTLSLFLSGLVKNFVISNVQFAEILANDVHMPMVGVDAEVGANIKMNTISRVLKYNVEEGKGTKLTQEELFGVASPMTCHVLCATRTV